MNRFSGISSLLISLALLTACTSNPRVQSDFDESVDFSQYKTFNFGSQDDYRVNDPLSSNDRLMKLCHKEGVLYENLLVRSSVLLLPVHDLCE